jgi:acid phosphatase type 7
MRMPVFSSLLLALFVVTCRNEAVQPFEPMDPAANGQAAGSYTLIAAGDIGCATSSGGQSTARLAQRLSGTVVTLGDNAYPNGTSADYRRCYTPGWGRVLARTQPSPGNHDYHVSGARGYFDYFGARAGPAQRGYYGYDLGAWHIVSLDSEINASATSPQAIWLKQDLASHHSRCSLAYWHRPLFTSGRIHPPALTMRPLFSLLYNAGAEIVLSGHNHQYERFAPQSPAGQGVSRGVRQFVVGTGGASLYPFGAPAVNSQLRYNRDYGVLKLTLYSNSYRWQFIAGADGKVIDAGTAACH